MCPVIFHIDVNSAYLSWSAVHMLSKGYPTDLRTVDAAVGGDTSKRRGNTRSSVIPAKRYHVRTGEPVTDALKKCPHLLLIPPDHDLYRQFSQEMRKILAEYSDDIRPYSIDECFMVYRPFPGDDHSPVKAAHIIRQRIFNELGFTVNVGISTNFLLAKMASDFEKPNRVHTLFPEEIPEKMWPLPVEDLFMVGHAAAARLELLGIRTIGELAHTDPNILYAHLKSHGRTIWEYANGIEKSPVETRTQAAKGIGHSTTLSADVTSVSEASQVLWNWQKKFPSACALPGFLPAWSVWRSSIVTSVPSPIKSNCRKLCKTLPSSTRQAWNYLTNYGQASPSVCWGCVLPSCPMRLSTRWIYLRPLPTSGIRNSTKPWMLSVKNTAIPPSSGAAA